MSEPKISVIVPIFNAIKYLYSTLKSLLAVTEPDIEIILVDDGSTDGSAELCDAVNDTRVRVIHKENGGVSSARNSGIEVARGEWLAFVDADDLVESDIFSYLLSGVKNHSAELIQCASYFETATAKTVIHTDGKAHFAASAKDMTNSFFKSFSNANWAKIYKKERFEKLRFNPDYTIGEDLRYNLDALAIAEGVLLMPEPKYRYIQRESSACYSAPSEKRLRSFYDMACAAETDFSAYPKIKGFVFAERMLATLDSLSKITLLGNDALIPLEKELRASVRRALPRALASGLIPLKEKCKLALTAIFPPIYRRLVKRGKKT